MEINRSADKPAIPSTSTTIGGATGSGNAGQVDVAADSPLPFENGKLYFFH